MVFLTMPDALEKQVGGRGIKIQELVRITVA
jgi:hypothetical protein